MRRTPEAISSAFLTRILSGWMCACMSRRPGIRNFPRPLITARLRGAPFCVTPVIVGPLIVTALFATIRPLTTSTTLTPHDCQGDLIDVRPFCPADLERSYPRTVARSHLALHQCHGATRSFRKDFEKSRNQSSEIVEAIAACDEHRHSDVERR